MKTVKMWTPSILGAILVTLGFVIVKVNCENPLGIDDYSQHQPGLSSEVDNSHLDNVPHTDIHDDNPHSTADEGFSGFGDKFNFWQFSPFDSQRQNDNHQKSHDDEVPIDHSDANITPEPFENHQDHNQDQHHILDNIQHDQENYPSTSQDQGQKDIHNHGQQGQENFHSTSTEGQDQHQILDHVQPGHDNFPNTALDETHSHHEQEHFPGVSLDQDQHEIHNNVQGQEGYHAGGIDVDPIHQNEVGTSVEQHTALTEMRPNHQTPATDRKYLKKVFRNVAKMVERRPMIPLFTKHTKIYPKKPKPHGGHGGHNNGWGWRRPRRRPRRKHKCRRCGRRYRKRRPLKEYHDDDIKVVYNPHLDGDGDPISNHHFSSPFPKLRGPRRRPRHRRRRPFGRRPRYRGRKPKQMPHHHHHHYDDHHEDGPEHDDHNGPHHIFPVKDDHFSGPSHSTFDSPSKFPDAFKPGPPYVEHGPVHDDDFESEKGPSFGRGKGNGFGRGKGHSFGRGKDHGFEHGKDHGHQFDHGKDHGPQFDHGNDHGPEFNNHGKDHGYEFDHGKDNNHGFGHENDNVKGFGRGKDHGHGFDFGKDQGKGFGSDSGKGNGHGFGFGKDQDKGFGRGKEHSYSEQGNDYGFDHEKENSPNFGHEFGHSFDQHDDHPKDHSPNYEPNHKSKPAAGFRLPKQPFWTRPRRPQSQPEYQNENHQNHDNSPQDFGPDPQDHTEFSPHNEDNNRPKSPSGFGPGPPKKPFWARPRPQSHHQSHHDFSHAYDQGSQGSREQPQNSPHYPTSINDMLPKLPSKPYQPPRPRPPPPQQENNDNQDDYRHRPHHHPNSVENSDHFEKPPVNFHPPTKPFYVRPRPSYGPPSHDNDHNDFHHPPPPSHHNSIDEPHNFHKPPSNFHPPRRPFGRPKPVYGPPHHENHPPEPSHHPGDIGHNPPPPGFYNTPSKPYGFRPRPPPPRGPPPPPPHHMHHSPPEHSHDHYDPPPPPPPPRRPLMGRPRPSPLYHPQDHPIRHPRPSKKPEVIYGRPMFSVPIKSHHDEHTHNNPPLPSFAPKPPYGHKPPQKLTLPIPFKKIPAAHDTPTHPFASYANNNPPHHANFADQSHNHEGSSSHEQPQTPGVTAALYNQVKNFVYKFHPSNIQNSTYQALYGGSHYDKNKHQPQNSPSSKPSSYSSPDNHISNSQLQSHLPHRPNKYSTLPDKWEHYKPDPTHSSLPQLTYDSNRNMGLRYRKRNPSGNPGPGPTKPKEVTKFTAADAIKRADEMKRRLSSENDEDIDDHTELPQSNTKSNEKSEAQSKTNSKEISKSQSLKNSKENLKSETSKVSKESVKSTPDEDKKSLTLIV